MKRVEPEIILALSAAWSEQKVDVFCDRLEAALDQMEQAGSRVDHSSVQSRPREFYSPNVLADVPTVLKGDIA